MKDEIISVEHIKRKFLDIAYADISEAQKLDLYLPEKVKIANPITYVTSDAPPFFIQHGSIDNHVPTEQSILLRDALIKAGNVKKVEFEIIEGAKNGGPLFKTEENVEKVFKFIDKYLK